jgi:hypothetical protein
MRSAASTVLALIRIAADITIKPRLVIFMEMREFMMFLQYDNQGHMHPSWRVLASWDAIA